MQTLSTQNLTALVEHMRTMDRDAALLRDRLKIMKLAMDCFGYDEIHATYDMVNLSVGDIRENDKALQRILRITDSASTT